MFFKSRKSGTTGWVFYTIMEEMRYKMNKKPAVLFSWLKLPTEKKYTIHPVLWLTYCYCHYLIRSLSSTGHIRPRAIVCPCLMYLICNNLKVFLWFLKVSPSVVPPTTHQPRLPHAGKHFFYSSCCRLTLCLHCEGLLAYFIFVTLSPVTHSIKRQRGGGGMKKKTLIVHSGCVQPQSSALFSIEAPLSHWLLRAGQGRSGGLPDTPHCFLFSSLDTFYPLCVCVRVLRRPLLRTACQCQMHTFPSPLYEVEFILQEEVVVEAWSGSSFS